MADHDSGLQRLPPGGVEAPGWELHAGPPSEAPADAADPPMYAYVEPALEIIEISESQVSESQVTLAVAVHTHARPPSDPGSTAQASDLPNTYALLLSESAAVRESLADALVHGNQQTLYFWAGPALTTAELPGARSEDLGRLWLVLQAHRAPTALPGTPSEIAAVQALLAADHGDTERRLNSEESTQQHALLALTRVHAELVAWQPVMPQGLLDLLAERRRLLSALPTEEAAGADAGVMERDAGAPERQEDGGRSSATRLAGSESSGGHRRPDLPGSSSPHAAAPPLSEDEHSAGEADWTGSRPAGMTLVRWSPVLHLPRTATVERGGPWQNPWPGAEVLVGDARSGGAANLREEPRGLRGDRRGSAPRPRGPEAPADRNQAGAATDRAHLVAQVKHLQRSSPADKARWLDFCGGCPFRNDPGRHSAAFLRRFLRTCHMPEGPPRRAAVSRTAGRP